MLDEVSGLVEWPVVLLGEFEEEFLDIPAEVIRLTIKANQKCFVCRKPDSEGLTNRFVLVANIEASDGGAEIAAGNAKVVRARLSDAVHFWKTDQADLPDVAELTASAENFGLDLAKPLDQRMAKLDHLGVTFHAKLGTQGERVSRIAELATELAPIVGVDPALARRAAVLAKADLTTEVVGEFPELQGAMGRKYAELQGEPVSVAAAIEEHYRPQGPSDDVPADPVSVAVALADKLDTLVGFWAIDEKPTGSKDPYALRRAALGVIRIVLENEVRLKLEGGSEQLYFSIWQDIQNNNVGRELDKLQDFHDVGVDTEALDPIFDKLVGEPRFDMSEGDFNDMESRLGNLLSFFHDRLKVHLRDSGARHDLIDAVITQQSDDLLLIVRRVEALGRFLSPPTTAPTCWPAQNAPPTSSRRKKRRALRSPIRSIRTCSTRMRSAPCSTVSRRRRNSPPKPSPPRTTKKP